MIEIAHGFNALSQSQWGRVTETGVFYNPDQNLFNIQGGAEAKHVGTANIKSTCCIKKSAMR